MQGAEVCQAGSDSSESASSTAPDSEAGKEEVEIEEQEKEVEHLSVCQQVIEQIRREEFGVDVVLSEDGQKLMAKQQERLGRSLDRLSKDLYSKDTHFVLELVQNADDNSYPQSR